MWFLYTEKERIDSGYFLHHTELKKKKGKKDKRRKEEKGKSASIGLGAMFEMDSLVDESNSSSNYSDEDFIITHKKEKRIRTIVSCIC